MVSLKYLSKFWKSLEMLLITWEVILILNWCKECVISSNALAAPTTTFTITDTLCYVLVATLSTEDKAKLFEQKRRVN